MGLYRKKPVVIEARQFTGSFHSADGIQGWAMDNGASIDQQAFGAEQQLRVHTLEGVMIAEPQDWIIKGVKGEFYPCKPDIFEATYEVA